jgi:hypothetical protein
MDDHDERDHAEEEEQVEPLTDEEQQQLRSQLSRFLRSQGHIPRGRHGERCFSFLWDMLQGKQPEFGGMHGGFGHHQFQGCHGCHGQKQFGHGCPMGHKPPHDEHSEPVMPE